MTEMKGPASPQLTVSGTVPTAALTHLRPLSGQTTHWHFILGPLDKVWLKVVSKEKIRVQNNLRHRPVFPTAALITTLKLHCLRWSCVSGTRDVRCLTRGCSPSAAWLVLPERRLPHQTRDSCWQQSCLHSQNKQIKMKTNTLMDTYV